MIIWETFWDFENEAVKFKSSFAIMFRKKSWAMKSFILDCLLRGPFQNLVDPGKSEANFDVWIQPDLRQKKNDGNQGSAKVR